MRKLTSVILFFALALSPFLSRSENILDAKALADVYQGDLILDDNNVTIIEGYFGINGSIYVKENATLVLRNAAINFTAPNTSIHMGDPMNGNPRLQVENTGFVGLHSDNRFYDNSSATFSNLTGNAYFYFNGQSSGSFADSNFSGFQARESSMVNVSNSALEYLDLVTYHGNASLVNLSPGFFDHWGFQENCSVVSTPQTEAPKVVLDETTVNNWAFSFQGNSTARIANCDLNSLHATMNTTIYPNARVDAFDSKIDTVEIYYSAIVTLTNTTYVDLDPSESSEIYVYWYLYVQVIDDSPSPGQSIESANVTASFANGTIAEQSLTDVDGWTRMTLMEKMTNETGNYPVGTYVVNASYLSYSNTVFVNMTGDLVVTLILEGFVVPEFPSLLILPLSMVGIFLAVVIQKRKRFRQSRHIGQ
jgi:hypothetical protein